ncbi:pyridoxamine 5'-phosphate oxidase family protein [Paenibacillus flagellatus]|uniref:Flavin-nucleotide-binding protein n=1 Tax=Paenibacillus flagellatus TaxID=2211139 RepID=A0A2V5JZ27_9BACL|nr:pyridoxamine 5'-phosphate oxidase family protein [Paenibacillus flagellatus]PYI52068.1 flavin-nucleotide-binding protein [Paenibacillus flagellatus]
MRRAAYEMTSEEEIGSFLSEMSYGTLAMRGEEWPYAVPINYVYHEGSVYLHGSKVGHKMDAIRESGNVAFSVSKEYAIVPSYFSDPKLACPATAYFKSVLIRGRIVPVEDPAEKAEALGALMRKLQPEGGYDPIDPADPAYKPRLEGVAVLRLDAVSTTAKFAFGQHLNDARFEQVCGGLKRRGAEADLETAGLMERYSGRCPFD